MWVAGYVGFVNLDQLAQVGLEVRSAGVDRPSRHHAVGWSASGERFAVGPADGFETRGAGLAWLAGLLDVGEATDGA